MDSQFSLAILLREAGRVNYVDAFGNCMMKAELDLCTDEFRTGSSEMAPQRGIFSGLESEGPQARICGLHFSRNQLLAQTPRCPV